MQMVKSKTGPSGHPKGPPRTHKWPTIRRKLKTRLDTRPIPVVDGWAGADMRVFLLFNLSMTKGRTDGQTDKSSYKVASLRLKRLY